MIRLIAIILNARKRERERIARIQTQITQLQNVQLRDDLSSIRRRINKPQYIEVADIDNRLRENDRLKRIENPTKPPF